jgi:WD40 repeat protein
MCAAQLVRTLDGHFDEVVTLAVHPEARFVYSGSADATIGLWDLSSGQVSAAAGGSRLQPNTHLCAECLLHAWPQRCSGCARRLS